MLTVSPAVSWTYTDGTLCVHGDALLRIEHCPPDIPECLRLLDAGTRLEGLLTEREPHTREVLLLLHRAGVLVRRPTGAWVGTAMERQVDYFAALGVDADPAQQRLERARVVILGVGGTGSVVLSHLVGAGVREFTLVDHDVVRLGNFNRQQLFTRADLGRPKVDAAADWVRARSPEALLRTVRERISSAEQFPPLLAGADVLVLAADCPPGEIQLLTAEACTAAEVAFTSASCGLRTGRIRPAGGTRAGAGVPGRVAVRARPGPAPAPMAASFGPTNTIAGAWAALRLIHWLAGVDGDHEAITVRLPEKAHRDCRIAAPQ